MATTSGVAATMADLITAISTFAQAQGWTEDAVSLPLGYLFLSKAGANDSCFTSFRWNIGAPQYLGIYNCRNHTGAGGIRPGNPSFEEDGQGFFTAGTPTNANLQNTSRHVQLDDVDNPYWIFGADDHIYVVVRRTPGTNGAFHHFGFGVAEKANDWVGGAFAFGQRVFQAATSAINATNTHLIDALCTVPQFVASMHVEGLPGQDPASKWGIFLGSSATATGTDSNGNPRERLYGGFRGNPVARAFGQLSGTNLAALAPIYPINFWHSEDGSNPEIIRPLGFLPNVGGIALDGYATEQTLLVGGDTWQVFPSYVRDTAANGTREQGIAYKQ